MQLQLPFPNPKLDNSPNHAPGISNPETDPIRARIKMPATPLTGSQLRDLRFRQYIAHHRSVRPPTWENRRITSVHLPLNPDLFPRKLICPRPVGLYRAVLRYDPMHLLP